MSTEIVKIKSPGELVWLKLNSEEAKAHLDWFRKNVHWRIYGKGNITDSKRIK
jgi:hypothetical protein